MADEQEALRRELRFLTALISNHKKTQNATPSHPRSHYQDSVANKYSKPHYERSRMSWTRKKNGQVNTDQRVSSKYSLKSTNTLNGAVSTDMLSVVKSESSKPQTSKMSPQSASHTASSQLHVGQSCSLGSDSTHIKGQNKEQDRTSKNINQNKQKTLEGFQIIVPVTSAMPLPIKPTGTDSHSTTTSSSLYSTSMRTSKYTWMSSHGKSTVSKPTLSKITQPDLCNKDNLPSTSSDKITSPQSGQVVRSRYKLKRVSSTTGSPTAVLTKNFAGKQSDLCNLKQTPSQSGTSKAALKTRYKYVRQNSKGKTTPKNQANLKSARTKFIAADYSPAIVTRYKYTRKAVANKYTKKPTKFNLKTIPTKSQLKLNRFSTSQQPKKNHYKLVRKPKMVATPRHGWISRFSLKKGDRMKVHNSARVINSSPFKLVKMPLRTKSRTIGQTERTVVPSRAKLKLDRRLDQLLDTNQFVSIGGILYRRSAKKLSKTTTPVKSHDNRTIIKKTRTQLVQHVPSKKQSHSDKVIINVRGQRFTMDSSGKTLKRWKEPETGNVAAPSIDKGMSRLDIGGMTFVQTTPGTLVRKETEYTKVMAHRVLQRSIQTTNAMKWKKSKPKHFCMFYNRFGKCNRGDKCPYIHDPDKVAVCTQFLRGTCKDSKCPFSHKVSKDKMPVCSYFLRGVCNRDDCPYLHVNVNRKAAVCEDFLKGYCPLGEKCKKRHVLECPDFAKTGTCPDGNKCKMMHRNRKTRKRKANVSKSNENDKKRRCSENHEAKDQHGESCVHERKRKISIDDKGTDDRSDGSGDEMKEDKDVSKRRRKLPSFISLVDNETQDIDSTQVQASTSQEALHIRPRFILRMNKEKNQEEGN
ncbi:uncharacterized protein LOC144438142 [Glandiceps talaboti]